MSGSRGHRRGLLPKSAWCSVLILAACESQPPPPAIAWSIDHDAGVEARWAQIPPLDPRIGPEQVVGTIHDLQIVSRLVPAGVPAPCLALSDGAMLAHDEPTWLYGARDPSGQTVLPCIYAAVLAAPDTPPRVIGYHRYPDVEQAAYLAGEWVTCIRNPGRACHHVFFGDDAWYECAPLGVSVGNGLPRTQAFLRVVPVTGDYRCGVTVGERRWSWQLPGNHTADGITLTHLAASLLRHDDGVLFCARATTGNDWSAWRIDPLTQKVAELAGTHYVFTVPPPPTADPAAVRRHHASVHDLRDDLRAYVTKPSPADPSLRWLRRQDGSFAPPPGTAGVQPLPAHAALYEPVSPQHSHQLVPVQYLPRVEQFLVAYDTPAGRRWGLASHDFSTVTGPLYQRVRWIDSPALTQRVGFFPDVLGRAQWLVLQRDADGIWELHPGSGLPGTAPRAGAEPEALAAAADVDVQAEQQPFVANAELRDRLNRIAAAAEAHRAAQVRAAELAEARRSYDWAIANGDGFRAFKAARILGNDALYSLVMRGLCSSSQAEEVLATGGWNEQQKSTLQANIANLQAREQEQRLAAQQARQQAAGSGSGGGGIDWAGWRRETMNAQSANQLGLTGEAFQSYLQRHR